LQKFKKRMQHAGILADEKRLKDYVTTVGLDGCQATSGPKTSSVLADDSDAAFTLARALDNALET
jgi:hypothetical protein